jgi:type I restriction-modification system DNA methylase subunit
MIWKAKAADYQARGVLYLPEAARFSSLIQLPEGGNIGAVINDAMRAIEAENPEPSGRTISANHAGVHVGGGEDS